MDEVSRFQRADRRECAHSHQYIPVAIEGNHLLIRLCECDTERDRRGIPHGADHVEMGGTIRDLVSLARRKPIADNDGLIGQQLQQGRHGLRSADQCALLGSHLTASSHIMRQR